MTKRVLGRGLEALLSVHDGEGTSESSTTVSEIPVDRVIPNDAQPRRRFDPDKIAELARSIESKGILQPIVVRTRGDRFQIIAGERRFLAAKQAGLRQVPVVIREVPDEEMLEWALIENLQRADLDPVEEAEAFRELIDNKGVTHEQLSVLVGRDRSSISNAIRLLRLSPSIRRALADGTISAGHGRALLQTPEGSVREKLFLRIVRQGLSVRQTEQIARGGIGNRKASGKDRKPSSAVSADPQIAHFEEQLRLRFGTRVRIKPGKKGGVVEIEYYSTEEFERIYSELIAGQEDSESEAERFPGKAPGSTFR